MLPSDDRDGIVLSVTLHVVVLLLLALAFAAPPEVTDPDWPPQLLEVEFGPAPVPPEIVGEPEAAEAGAPSRAMEQPEEERPTPPAPSPARIPERQPTPPKPDRPLPRPAQADDAPAARPNPPSRATRPEPDPRAARQPEPSTSAGTSEGTSRSAGADTGAGRGSGGDAPAEVGFQFGNRTYDCPTPPFSGVEGEVTYRVTFAPNGRYVADRPVTRNGALDASVRSVISRCRAEALPSNALQVNQTTQATFRFRAN
ncbi:hypothetical protein [Rubrivirga sp. IMCC45206]|uniref:energy transducer TonB family protein n=1 Tax=Rubrivirga sp. IMCC45206 TaxID=3391614 RepID=UPI00398FAF1B